MAFFDPGVQQSNQINDLFNLRYAGGGGGGAGYARQVIGQFVDMKDLLGNPVQFYAPIPRTAEQQMQAIGKAHDEWYTAPGLDYKTQELINEAFRQGGDLNGIKMGRNGKTFVIPKYYSQNAKNSNKNDFEGKQGNKASYAIWLLLKAANMNARAAQLINTDIARVVNIRNKMRNNPRRHTNKIKAIAKKTIPITMNMTTGMLDEALRAKSDEYPNALDITNIHRREEFKDAVTALGQQYGANRAVVTLNNLKNMAFDTSMYLAPAEVSQSRITRNRNLMNELRARMAANRPPNVGAINRSGFRFIGNDSLRSSLDGMSLNSIGQFSAGSAANGSQILEPPNPLLQSVNRSIRSNGPPPIPSRFTQSRSGSVSSTASLQPRYFINTGNYKPPSQFAAVPSLRQMAAQFQQSFRT